MKKAILLLTVLLIGSISAYTNIMGGLKTIINTTTLVAADTVESEYLLLWGEYLTGDTFWDWQIINIANNTKYKIYYLYGNDTTVMADTVLADSGQAETNGSLKHRLKPAYYYKTYIISWGSAGDTITAKLKVNFIRRSSGRR